MSIDDVLFFVAFRNTKNKNVGSIVTYGITAIFLYLINY